MSWGRHPRGGAAYGGAREIPTAPGGGIITDPANPDTPGYRWSTQPGGGPWAGIGWAGGGSVSIPAAGGLSVEPDPNTATVGLRAWWSGAPFLRLLRIQGTERVPVRGAYPVRATTPTRRNRCTNPSFETDTTGWVAGTNTTATRVLDAAAPSGTAVGRLSATAAGAVSTIVPGAPATQDRVQVSLALRLSVAPTGALSLTQTWQDSEGVALPASVATLPAADLPAYVGAFRRTPHLVLVPPPGAAQGSLTLAVAGLPAAATADIDAALIETGTAVGDYFDGDTPTGSWTLLAHRSESLLAAALEVLDAEAPLDVPVSYELTAPNAPGFRVLSEPVTLPSRDRAWLTHPERAAPLSVHVEAEPELTYPIAQGIFTVHGRPRPVVVSASVRGSAAGGYRMASFRFADRDQLLDMLSDGSPLLLRMPARLGHGPSEWIAVGDVTVSVDGHGGWERPRHFTLPYRVVDPPALPTAEQAGLAVA